MAKVETIWKNCTVMGASPAGGAEAGAVAVAGGRIVAIGPEAETLAGAGTRVVDLGGRHIMPGLIDTHTHGLWGACRDLFDVYVGYTATLDELVQAVADRVADMAPGDWLVGGPWRYEMRDHMGARPCELLDRIAPHHPVVLRDASQHNAWANSLALKLAGVTRDTPQPDGGVIEMDPGSGEPTGILSETGATVFQSFLPRTPAQMDQAARYLVETFNGMGITGFKEPMALEPDLIAYKSAADAGRLSLHSGMHLTRSSPIDESRTPFDTLDRWRRDYAGANMHTGFAKLFLDGVAPSFTAAFFEPYLASSGYDAANHDPDAVLLIDPDTLAEEVSELDRRGYVVKMHAVGDRAVNAGLDAIAAARAANGASGLRHEIAHCTFVSSRDYGRFAELDAICEVSPKLWFPTSLTAGQVRVLGDERTRSSYPIRSIMEQGAEMIYGSDWPAAVPDANPWIGLAGMVMRRNPLGLEPGSLGADQAISLEQALPLFTTNGARSLGLEQETGSLVVGKSADFIVIDTPLAQTAPEDIAHMQVRQTVFQGAVVHDTL